MSPQEKSLRLIQLLDMRSDALREMKREVVEGKFRPLSETRFAEIQRQIDREFAG